METQLHTCPLCVHPARSAIDQALFRGESVAAVAVAHGIPEVALQLHWTGYLADLRDYQRRYLAIAQELHNIAAQIGDWLNVEKGVSENVRKSPPD